jgi:hypothetical protein
MKSITSIALALTFVLSACSTQTALVNSKSGQNSKEEMQTFFVGGLGQTQSINVATVWAFSLQAFTPLTMPRFIAIKYSPKYHQPPTQNRLRAVFFGNLSSSQRTTQPL